MTDTAPQPQTFELERRPIEFNRVLLAVVGSTLLIAITVLCQETWNPVVLLSLACLVGLLWLIAMPYDWWSWLTSGGRSLRLDADGLDLEEGGMHQRVAWGVIVRVQIQSVDTGTRVDIYSRVMELHGFERMPEIADLIQAGVGRTVPVERG
jgi:hypothetical protein